MRGTISGRENRDATRTLWRQQHIPGYIMGEVQPVCSLLSRDQDLVLVDVGANKGFWTKAFLTAVGGRVAHVHMLDPSPENFAELTRTVDSLLFDPDDFQRMTAHNVAAGSSEKQGILYTDEDGSPLASLYDHHDSGESGALAMGDDAGGLRAVQLDREIPVSITTIDAFVAANHIGHIDVLKIDTEGNEYDVLMGARQTLASRMVDCIFFEFGTHQVESRTFFIDFYKLMSRSNYDMFSVVDGQLHKIEKYSYQYEDFTRTFTFAARRREAPQGALAGFSEEAYLRANPDVLQAVTAGALPSGTVHWMQFGRFENRKVA